MIARSLILGLAPLLCGALRAWAAEPADLPRAEICLNGTWETVVNAGGESVPAAGWSPRRVPAIPIAGTDPPTTSVWYRHRLAIPRAWYRTDRRFYLTLDKAGHYAALYVDGRLVAEHYGQFTPFEADLTEALFERVLTETAEPVPSREIAVYVHDASGKYARPGAVIADARDGNAYRGATDRPEQRNWVGIVGDIVLSWRPATALGELQVTTSVRSHRVEVEVRAGGVGAGPQPSTLRATVLDDGRPVLALPDATVTPGASTKLAAAWDDPVLWGPPPYGTPKLYVLRTELLRAGAVVDRSFTRFGFREVWVEGRDVLFNGKKLWMTGTYYGKLAPLRYINDRRPLGRTLEVMQASGLNTLHGHWDDLGTPWLDACDERGMLVLAGFYCDGRPQIQSRADAGWEDWMADTAARWTRQMRNHPSVVMYRPIDLGPVNAMANSHALFNHLADRVRREDDTRPFVFGNDGSEIDAWSQSPLKDPRDKTAYDDGSRMAARFTGTSKPFLTKEIYAGFADVENLSRFFRVFAEKSFALGGTGLIVQHLPLITRSRPFTVQWLSPSGLGNRDTPPALSPGSLPNWCDPEQPVWTPSPYSDLFRTLHQELLKEAPKAFEPERAAELLVSGLTPDALALLVPRNPAVAGTVGVRAAADGTAWIVPPQPGDYVLVGQDSLESIHVSARRRLPAPGYGDVERVKVVSKP